MNIALEVKNLEKNYEKFSLNKISFKIPSGSIMGFVGTNGAGKSTTMKAILQLISSDGGEILIDGQPMKEKDTKWKENIGVVLDEIHFYETLTPKKIGNILKNAYKKWNMAQYETYMTRFQIPMNQEIKTFSKGMKVKLSLASAMSHEAKLLILDEPTSGLDPIVREEILDCFLDFVQKEDHSILVSSHITTDLEKIADYITFIDKGDLLLTAPKDELLYEYGILRCKKSEFDQIDKEDILAYKHEEYQVNILVRQKEKIQKKYEKFVVDATTLDEIMLLFVKGEVCL